MSVDLENYLNQQREMLDVESPDDQMIWEGIRTGLHRTGRQPERRRVLIQIRNIAALELVLISVGYVVIDLTLERRSGMELSLADIDQELGVKEKEYRALVSYKQEEAGMFRQVDNVLISELLEEIQSLDTIYKLTMKDLSELGYNEQVIQTIFDTYEKKIFLLELIILENNRTRIYESDENTYL